MSPAGGGVETRPRRSEEPGLAFSFASARGPVAAGLGKHPTVLVGVKLLRKKRFSSLSSLTSKLFFKQFYNLLN